MNFEFATATRIVFGPGRLAELGRIVQSLGKRPLLVTGRDSGRNRRAGELLAGAGGVPVQIQVDGEPTVPWVTTAVETARTARCDVVIAVGGGSAIDAGKAIAALVPNAGGALDYLEIIGAGRPLTQTPLPFVAVPTTAGTGAEVTRNAVLGSPAHRLKTSLRSPLMLPRVALVDPELTLGLPPLLTATTGLDALTQLIEPYLSCRANPLSDAFCAAGIVRSARSLERAWAQPQDAAAREDLSLCSLLSGLALANSGLGAVHGMAAPLGGRFGAPHGAVCAALLPHVLRLNLDVLRQARPDSPVLARFDQVARWVTGNPAAVADDGIAWVTRLVRVLGIPGLAHHGIRVDDARVLAEQALQASSMAGNPIPLSLDDVAGVVMRAL